MSLTLLTSKSCPSTQFTSTALGPFLCSLILICNKKYLLKPDFRRNLNYRNARQAVVWLGLQVNFKYHEIMKFFRKNAPPGIEPAIPQVGDECLNHSAIQSGLAKWQKLCTFIVFAKKNSNFWDILQNKRKNTSLCSTYHLVLISSHLGGRYT